MNSERKVLGDTANSASRLPKYAPKRKNSSEQANIAKKIKFEQPVRATIPKTSAVSQLTTNRVTGRNTARRETMPARSHKILNSTVADPSAKGAVRPCPISVSPIQGSKQKVVRKRPTWDLKGRIQDMEEQLKTKKTLEQQLHLMTSRIEQLENGEVRLTTTVTQKEEVASSLSKEIEDLKHSLQMKERESENIRRDRDEATRRETTLTAQLNAKEMEVIALKSSIAEQSAAHSVIRADLEVAKLNFESSQNEVLAKKLKIDELEKTIQNLESIIENNNQVIMHHETIRRNLHNTVLELKGNIRVFCRVRPLLPEEINNGYKSLNHIIFPDIDNKMMALESLSSGSQNSQNDSLSKTLNPSKKRYEFSFDKVFQPDNTQAEVFNEISQLVQSALDGYNVCIFAYGQTGSGKTYTMEGGNIEEEETMGMIPRAMIQVFETVENLEEKGWKYDLKMSYLEIYNEILNDLLSDNDGEKHEIKMAADKSSTVSVTNLTSVPVTSRSQIHKLLLKASKKRAVGETKLNDRSSRSHSVFTLVLKGHNELTDESCSGCLNLVDLAGSERLKDSGSEGKRLKETQCINKSLSALSTVFTALHKKDTHIPYRNSKLTYLLQNSLGGNSKTLMFVNVSPKEDNFNETLNSLRFATHVNNCSIGTARKK
ncbi:carboxy-terminal kinesin 2-like [Argonauta hians]